tara:strand:+ start:8811 stop:9161 length:351 start_codon:yes stop_codon:yes gene_type:complete
MSTVTKIALSGSTNGQPIKIVRTSTPGTTIHDCHATSIDTLFLTVTNTSGGAVAFTIEKGGTTNPDNLVVDAYSVPADGYPYALPAMIGTGSINIDGFGGSANVLLVDGFVNRFTS